jgi:hypothetical protein
VLDGVEVYYLRDGEDFGTFYGQQTEDRPDRRELLNRLDLSRIFEFDPVRPSALRGLVLEPGQRLQGVLTFRASKNVQPGWTQRFTVVQEQSGSVVGGSTYELRLNRARGLLPVSRIRVVMEHLKIDGSDTIEHLAATLALNDDPHRQYTHDLGRAWTDIDSERGVCVFDGYVAESDRATILIASANANGESGAGRSWYQRAFDGPPEMWVGRYGGDGEDVTATSSRELHISYRIESVPLS